MYPVITINREFGSGGHSIGTAVADRLLIPVYDGEIVEACSVQCGYAKEIIEEQGEQSRGLGKWFDVSASSLVYFQSPQDEIYLAQRKVIIDFAQKGPCVIIGRCSDYILDHPDLNIKCAHVLIHADMESRKKRVLERYGEIEGIDITKRIQKKDKQRQNYYRYYTDRNWGSYPNYTLALDSGVLGEKTCVDLICAMAESMK